MYQELDVVDGLTIAENIFLGNENATRGVIDWNKTNRDAALLLARVGLDENPATNACSRLPDTSVPLMLLRSAPKHMKDDEFFACQISFNSTAGAAPVSANVSPSLSHLAFSLIH